MFRQDCSHHLLTTILPFWENLTDWERGGWFGYVNHDALYFEINPIYEKETREMLEGLDFKAIDTKEDAFGKQRMMRAGKS